MDLLQEYEKQQAWRNWDEYLQHIPLHANDRVLDLGCSVGAVSNLFAKQVEWVTGVDLNRDMIRCCEKSKSPNQSFICENFENVNYKSLQPITGIWSSFSLSYLPRPMDFLSHLHKVLEPRGWIALVDVSCFLSGNMPQDGLHHDRVLEFERNSCQSSLYDFDFGSKMEAALEATGFQVIHLDDDVSDPELNDWGRAGSEILANWEARLERMQGLRSTFPSAYDEVCAEVLSHLGSPLRRKRNNVRFVVGRKT